MGPSWRSWGWSVCVVVACGAPDRATESGGSSGPGGDATASSGAATSAGPGPTSSSGGVTPGGTETGGSSGAVSEGLTTGAASSGPQGSSSATGDEPGTSGMPDPGGEIVVQNPGFEVDAVEPGKYNDKIVPAFWSRHDPANIIGQDYNSLGVLNPAGTTLYPGGAPEGSNVALVFLWRAQTDGVPAGYVQVLGDMLQADTTYTLRVKVGNIAPEANAAYDLGGFPGYRVELLAGDVVLAADANTLAPAEGSFLQSEVVFTATADDPGLGLPLAIRLINLNKGDSGIEVNFDDVELLTAAQP